ncbi:MAG TPA: hypothetical protein PKC49_02210 [Phycisphaerae bacterium]|nr:hypothetical protein [Phycisphaerae bacterium]
MSGVVPFSRRRLSLVLGTVCLGAISVALSALIPTTPNDFFMPGTQPETLGDFIFESTNCNICHGYYNEAHAPWDRWANTLMAQAARDPVFWACLAIANQDLEGAGEFCIRCHSPGAWLEGRATPADGSAFIPKDFDGVNCHTCHRLVDPVYSAENPLDDIVILEELEEIPPDPHNGQFVVDPYDRRRGPRDLGQFPYHAWRQSPYHRESFLCATCHDVSNPAYTRQPDGSYKLGPLDAPHPTHVKSDQFPIERTYSEWSKSAFAQGPIDMGGRFGGNQPLVSSCQDCHMPKTSGTACIPGLAQPRDDLAVHALHGGNTWVLAAVRNLFDDGVTGLTAESVALAQQRTREFLAAASDLELTQPVLGEINARVINQTGHKLPTGYPEGRRMWVNVRFLDHNGELVREHGAYDAAEAKLTTGDTKVYEAKLGLSQDVADLTGLPAGESFHFALNNVWLFDNRIPPRGFTNAGFAEVQAAPVGCSYEDGQYWDDTAYAIPPGAVRVEVRVLFQTSTREYMEFLRDANTTNNAGEVAYQQWVATGRSAPAEMDFGVLALAILGDLNGDGRVDQSDLGILLAAFGTGPEGDLDGDGDTDQADLGVLLAYFGTGW